MFGWFLAFNATKNNNNNNNHKCPERFAPSKAQMNTIEYKVSSLEFSVKSIKTEISLLRKAIELSNKRINNRVNVTSIDNAYNVPSYDKIKLSREEILNLVSYNENGEVIGINCQGEKETTKESIEKKIMLLEDNVELLKNEIFSLTHETELLKNNKNIHLFYSEFAVHVKQNEKLDDFKTPEINDKKDNKVKNLEYNIKILKKYISSLRKETELLKKCIDKVKSEWAIGQAYNIMSDVSMSDIIVNDDLYSTD